MKLNLLATVCASAVLAASSAQALPITIINPSFESPDDNGIGTNFATGWTSSGGGSGVWNPNEAFGTQYFPSAPDGNQIGFASSAPNPGSAASLTQDVGAIQAGGFYTLTGYVGHPTGFKIGTVYTISLLAGSEIVASKSGTATEGSFEKFLLTYHASATENRDLTIVLASNKAQTGFDKIALNIPDGGGTAVLLGCSMLGLVYFRNRFSALKA